MQQEQAKAIAELRLRQEDQESLRFFHQPTANADFAHWSRAAYWTLDEAVALSFGKSPFIVKWESVKPYLPQSAFAVAYSRLRDLTLRAKGAGVLFDPVLPGIYIGWAKQNRLPFPADLEAAVVALGNHILDWKSMYDELKTRTEATNGELTSIINQWTKRYEELRTEAATAAASAKANLEAAQQRIAELTADRDRLETELKNVTTVAKSKPDRPLGTRERDTVLKLIIGMAVKGYAYAPGKSRNSATAEIASDLAELGIGLDPDTVRKWLQEAATLLPRESGDG